MPNNLNLKLFGLFITADLFSALAYYVPGLRNVIFIGLIFIVFILTLRRLEYGLSIILAEIFVGSKGYLFSFDIGETIISIRVAAFIIFFSVFFARLLLNLYSNTPVYRTRSGAYGQRSFLVIVGLFFAVISFGALNGLWRGHGFGPVFLDANGYFFLFLIFPVLYLIRNPEPRLYLEAKLPLILFSGAAWLAVKTLILFSLFVHVGNTAILGQIYLWVRNTVGEITPAGQGTYRIFIQSQLFIVLAYLIFLTIKKSFRRTMTLLGGIYLSAILISMSRSFWIGVVAAAVYFFAVCSLNKDWKSTKIALNRMISSGILGAIILAIIYLPALGSIGQRGKDFIKEPAVSSRLAQLRPLVAEIIKSPILGHGFGRALTYKTSDPRILSVNPTGEYTTYAFELGYLDILLKLGLVGLFVYLLLIFNLFRNMRSLGLRAGLVAILIINIFSPYLNHPLGIGFLLLSMILNQESSELTIS